MCALWSLSPEVSPGPGAQDQLPCQDVGSETGRGALDRAGSEGPPQHDDQVRKNQAKNGLCWFFSCYHSTPNPRVTLGCEALGWNSKNPVSAWPAAPLAPASRGRARDRQAGRREPEPALVFPLSCVLFSRSPWQGRQPSSVVGSSLSFSALREPALVLCPRWAGPSTD